MPRFMLAFMLLAGVSEAQTIAVNPSSVLQTIDGFGAAVAFTRFTLPASQMDFFYTGAGIGLSIMRLDVYPDTASCVEDNGAGNCVASSGATTTIWELTNAQAAIARGATIFASCWSPPGAMKSNGDYETGGNYLGGATNNANLAAALGSFVTLMTGAYQIPIYAISFQNEPDQSQPYPSSLWTPQQIHDFVPYLHSALATAGYPAVRIMLAEQSSWAATYAATAMSDPAVAPDVGILAAHAYSGAYSAMSLASYGNVTNQHLWQTEVSDFDDTYDGSITSALTYATQIYQWLVGANANAWLYWLVSGEGVYSDNEALNSYAGVPAARAYAMGNWARFVKPGWSQVSVANQNANGMLVSAFTNGTASMAIVVVNNQSSAVTGQAFTLGGFAATQVTPWITSSSYNLQAQAPVAVSGNTFSYTIPAYSIVTLVSTSPSGSALNGGITTSGGVLIQ